MYDGHRDWENRVYRQVWNRIRQAWTAEKWIRVTDDKTNLDWVGLNQQITVGQMLQDAAQQDPEAQMMLQGMMAQRDPRLNEVAEVKNNVAEMDVDIIIADAPDTHTLKQETFEILISLAERYGPDKVPFEAALELSDMPNKGEVKKLLNPPVDPEVQAQQQAVQELMFKLEVEGKQAVIDKDKAKAQRDLVETESQMIENELVRDSYPNLVIDRDSDSVAKQLDNIQKQVETVNLANKPDEDPQVSV